VRLASEEAYHQIKEKIITLDLAPSSVINEQALMKNLGLGRTPIREALQRLDAEGLVHIVPRRGMFVTDISITDLQEIFEVRIVMAGFCARLAARRITPEQIAQLEAVLRDLEHVQSVDSIALMDIDKRFQRILYQAADNKFLTDALERLYDSGLRLWHLVLHRLGDVRDAIEQHREVLEALKARDEKMAESLIQQHIADFQNAIKAVL